MKKEITYSIYINTGKNEVAWNDLTSEEKKQISIKLNDRAMQSIGYRRKDKTA